MKSFWRWTGTIFFALAFVFLVLTGVGTSLPIDHQASCAATFNAPGRLLFETIADDAGSVRWRHDIASAVLVSRGGPDVWRETDPHGNSTTYRTTAYTGYADGYKLARTIDYVPGLPFAGTWTYWVLSGPGTVGIGMEIPSPHTRQSKLDSQRAVRETIIALRRLSPATYAPSGMTRVTITENGKIYNPFFRFLSRYVVGYTQRMQAYLTDLAIDFKQSPQISCVAGG